MNHNQKEKGTGAKRHLVEAKTSDQYNRELSLRLESLIVPSGYQDSRHGFISIRQHVSKRTVDDIIYQVILEVSKQKVYTLKYIVDNIRAADAEVVRLSEELNKLPRYWFLRWIQGMQYQYRTQTDQKDVQLHRLGILHGIRAHLEKHGPMIPDEIKLNNGLV